MYIHPYKTAGIYADAAHALAARQSLLEIDLDLSRVSVIGTQCGTLDSDFEGECDRLRWMAARDLIAGTGADAVAGLVAVGMLSGMGVTLTVSQPVVAAVLGPEYGFEAQSGARGAGELDVSDARFAALVRDALAEDRWIVLVHCDDEMERDAVRAILGAGGA